MPRGTAYISDVGMTGSRASVLGVRWEQALEGFRTQMPVKFDTADEDIWVNAVSVAVRSDGLAESIEQILEPVPD
jgi:2',3'-cyclic-nucleotide 2'-phosphodiesterase